ncbi:hypothetical protein ACQ4PT_030204 [Festuca glaucescens]
MDDDDVGGGGDASPQHQGDGAVVAERGGSGALVPRDVASSPTSSRSVTETVNGSHRFVIQGYSLAKGMGVGKHIASETFTVGGYQWAIYFYPDGKNPEDNSAYVSVFIALASEGTDVRALFELTLQDQSGRGKHKVHSHFDRSLESGPYTLKYRGSMWGYKRFFRRTALETSDFLKDDCLKINCTVGVVTSTMDYSRPHSLEVPDSDIGYHFGTLLDSQEGADIIFSVAGQKFHAHKLVLAARSSFLDLNFLILNQMKRRMSLTQVTKSERLSSMTWSQKCLRLCFILCTGTILLVMRNCLLQAQIVLSLILWLGNCWLQQTNMSCQG